MCEALADNIDYQKYKDYYGVYFGYLIVSKKLTDKDIKIIERNYLNWECIKKHGLMGRSEW